jgi:hypothetical protein
MDKVQKLSNSECIFIVSLCRYFDLEIFGHPPVIFALVLCYLQVWITDDTLQRKSELKRSRGCGCKRLASASSQRPSNVHRRDTCPNRSDDKVDIQSACPSFHVVPGIFIEVINMTVMHPQMVIYEHPTQ